MDWKTLSLVERLAPPHQRAARDIIDELRTVARADELTSKVKLAAALTTARRKASDLLERVIISEKDEEKDDHGREDEQHTTRWPVTTRSPVTAANLDEVLESLRQAVQTNATKTFKVTWQEIG